MLYDHNTYFLSSPVIQTYLIDLYRKMSEQFRPELFDDSVKGRCKMWNEMKNVDFMYQFNKSI
jgi:hypothetical protein